MRTVADPIVIGDPEKADAVFDFVPTYVVAVARCVCAVLRGDSVLFMSHHAGGAAIFISHVDQVLLALGKSRTWRGPSMLESGLGSVRVGVVGRDENDLVHEDFNEIVPGMGVSQDQVDAFAPPF